MDVVDAADGVSKEQLIEQLVTQKVLRGAADAFYLEEILEWTADAECVAPNGAAGVTTEGDDLRE